MSSTSLAAVSVSRSESTLTIASYSFDHREEIPLNRLSSQLRVFCRLPLTTLDICLCDPPEGGWLSHDSAPTSALYLHKASTRQMKELCQAILHAKLNRISRLRVVFQLVVSRQQDQNAAQLLAACATKKTGLTIDRFPGLCPLSMTAIFDNFRSLDSFNVCVQPPGTPLHPSIGLSTQEMTCFCDMLKANKATMKIVIISLYIDCSEDRFDMQCHKLATSLASCEHLDKVIIEEVRSVTYAPGGVPRIEDRLRTQDVVDQLTVGVHLSRARQLHCPSCAEVGAAPVRLKLKVAISLARSLQSFYHFLRQNPSVLAYVFSKLLRQENESPTRRKRLRTTSSPSWFKAPKLVFSETDNNELNLYLSHIHRDTVNSVEQEQTLFTLQPCGFDHLTIYHECNMKGISLIASGRLATVRELGELFSAYAQIKTFTSLKFSLSYCQPPQLKVETLRWANMLFPKLPSRLKTLDIRHVTIQAFDLILLLQRFFPCLQELSLHGPQFGPGHRSSSTRLIFPDLRHIVEALLPVVARLTKIQLDRISVSYKRGDLFSLEETNAATTPLLDAMSTNVNLISSSVEFEVDCFPRCMKHSIVPNEEQNVRLRFGKLIKRAAALHFEPHQRSSTSNRLPLNELVEHVPFEAWLMAVMALANHENCILFLVENGLNHIETLIERQIKK